MTTTLKDTDTKSTTETAISDEGLDQPIFAKDTP
jgi:hypothetical protein